MTVKLYDEDAYQKKFTGQVVSCEKYPAATEAAETTLFDVVLDRTLFSRKRVDRHPTRECFPVFLS